MVDYKLPKCGLNGNGNITSCALRRTECMRISGDGWRKMKRWSAEGRESAFYSERTQEESSGFIPNWYMAAIRWKHAAFFEHRMICRHFYMLHFWVAICFCLFLVDIENQLATHTAHKRCCTELKTNVFGRRQMCNNVNGSVNAEKWPKN